MVGLSYYFAGHTEDPTEGEALFMLIDRIEIVLDGIN
jgi:hypothetical protein